MAKVDKTMTAMVLEVLSNRDGKAYGFKVPMTDGIIQQFTLGNRAVGCPEQGMIVRIEFNIQPAGEGYEDRGDTYWCNSWVNTNGGTPTSEPNSYETQAQRIEQQEADYEPVPVEGTQAQPRHGGLRRTTLSLWLSVSRPW